MSYPRNNFVGCAALPRARGSAVVVFTVYGNKLCCAYRLQILRATFSTAPERRTASSDRGSGPARGFGESSNTHLQLTRRSTRKKKERLVLLPRWKCAGAKQRGSNTEKRKSSNGSLPDGGCGRACLLLFFRARVTDAVFTPASGPGGGHCYYCVHMLYAINVASATRCGGAAAIPHGPLGTSWTSRSPIIQPPDEPQIYIKSGPRASRIRSNSADDEDGEDDDDN